MKKKFADRLEKKRDLPGDEFLFAQFLIATDVQSADDVRSAFLRIVFAFAFLLADEIVLK